MPSHACIPPIANPCINLMNINNLTELENKNTNGTNNNIMLQNIVGYFLP